MRYGKVIACILTLVFLAAAVGIGAMDDLPELAAETVELAVAVAGTEGTQIISCWEQEDGAYYAFLPSYARLADVEFRLEKRQTVTIDGQRIRDGMSCGAFGSPSTNIPSR